MGWRERDYSQASWRGSSAAWRPGWPPPVTLGLLISHAVLFLALTIVRAEAGPAIESWVRLGGATAGASTAAPPPAAATRDAAPLRPLAVLLHPIAGGVLTLAFVLCTIWLLAAPLESRIGGGRVLAAYAFGSVVAGAAYYAAARAHPAGAVLPLDYSVGGFVAWCVISWHVFSNDFVVVFTKVTTRAKLIAICALVSIGLALIGSGFGAVAWLAAVLAGLPAAYLLGLLEPLWARRGRAVRLHRGLARETVARVPVRVAQTRVAPSIPPSAEGGPDVDEILAKISRHGLSSLTSAERAQLETARQAMLHAAAPNRHVNDE